MKIKSLAMAAILSLFPVLNAQAEIRFGIMNEAYPPFFTQDASGKWIGWEIELMEAVCAEMGEECSIVGIAWDGLIPALQTKKFDVIWSSMNETDERSKILNFTNKYYNTIPKLIGPKGQAKGTEPEDVAGKTIGIQVATIQSLYYQKYYASHAAEKTYATLDEAFQDLANGRIDYVFGDSIVLQEFIKSDFGQSCCEDMGNVKEDREIFGSGVSGGLRKEDTELLAKLNAAIAAVRASGKYDEISAKYFDFDIYGE